MTKEKRNLLRALTGIVIFCFLFIGIERLFFTVRINSTVISPAKMIYEKEQIDVLFMGSSYIFSTFDALFLSKNFEKRFYVFGVSAGSVDVFLEGLKTILKYQKPKIIIIGVDSLFHLSTRERKDRIGVTMSAIDSINGYLDKIKFASAVLDLSDIPMGLFQIFRQTNTWLRWLFLKLKIVHPEFFALEIYTRISTESQAKQLKENQKGSFDYYYLNLKESFNLYGNFSFPSIGLYHGNNFHELFERGNLKINEKLIKNNLKILREIAQICKDNDIRLWLVQSPSISLSSKEMEYIKEQIQEYDIEYFDNLKEKIDVIGLTKLDYQNRFHLNRHGMMKTTHYYAKLIQERMKWNIVNDNLFAYDGESIEEIGKEKWRYTMKNTQKESLYRFVLIDDKRKTIKTQKFSKQNYFDCDINILRNSKYDVEVTVLPAGIKEFDKETINKVGMVLMFMKYNRQKLD